MCYYRKKIYNPAKVHLLDDSSPAVLEVDCGECSQCLQTRINEYTFRCYYQARSCIERGGYVYFTTLTYRDSELPHVSDFTAAVCPGSFADFMCFDDSDFVNFMKSLRSNLKRSGYDPKEHLKIFFSSEYGEDPNRTHRIHYHVLLFNSIPGLSWHKLSEVVDDTWCHGRTDGVKYKDNAYVIQHVYGADGDGTFDDVIVRKVSNYVAKYVNKDSEFLKQVQHRWNLVEDLFKYWWKQNIKSERVQDCKKLANGNIKYLDNWLTMEDSLKRLKRHVFPYHRQSIGFGSDFLLYNDLAEIEKTGKIKMPDEKLGIKELYIPMYYRRKLYYDLLYDKDGKPYWVKNDAGMEHNRRYVYNSIDALASRFQDWYDNLNTYLCVDNIGEVRSGLLRYLNGRSWRNLAEYVLLYRGRLLSSKSKINYDLHKDARFLSVQEQIDNIYKSAYDVQSLSKLAYFDSDSDITYVDQSVPLVFGYGLMHVRPGFNRLSPKYDSAHRSSYIREHLLDSHNIIHDVHSPRFRNFDLLLDFYVSSLAEYNDMKDSRWFYLRDLRRKVKNLVKRGIVYSPGYAAPVQGATQINNINRLIV